MTMLVVMWFIFNYCHDYMIIIHSFFRKVTEVLVRQLMSSPVTTFCAHLWPMVWGHFSIPRLLDGLDFVSSSPKDGDEFLESKSTEFFRCHLKNGADSEELMGLVVGISSQAHYQNRLLELCLPVFSNTFGELRTQCGIRRSHNTHPRPCDRKRKHCISYFIVPHFFVGAMNHEVATCLTNGICILKNKLYTGWLGTCEKLDLSVRQLCPW